jgi:regulator of RNase E activity RraA
VVPAAQAEEVISLAEVKSAAEDVVRLALAAGASVWETFQQHGVI